MIKRRIITINGVTRNLDVKKNSLNIIHELQNRSTASFTLGRGSAEEGQEVIIEEQGLLDVEPIRLFGGTINRVASAPVGQSINYLVSCVDFNAIADRRTVAEAFDAQTSGNMVIAIWEQKLQYEGVTLGFIEPGPVTSRSVFDYKKVSQALNEISEKTGIRWNIDYFKRLDYFSPGHFSSPFELTETSANYKDLRLERNRDKYRNVQIFRPGDIETALQPAERPSPAPDGVSKTFILRFPISRKPVILINAVPVDESQIGILGLDEPGTKQWYWKKGSNQIVQENVETELPLGTSLEVDYYGLRRVVLIKEEGEQILARQAIEGGTGIYEAYDERATVDTSQAANEVVDGLLRKYGRIPNILTYQTNYRGLRAGMTQKVNIPSRNISGDFLIERVVARADGSFMNYSVTAVDTEDPGGWKQFFAKLIDGVRGFSIRENESVDLLAGIKEVGLQEIADTCTTVDASPPFQAGVNIVFGRWQCLAE